MRSSDLLRSIDLFEELSPEDVDQLALGVHDRVVRAGESVYADAATYPALFVVVDGLIQIETVQVGPGESWGEASLLSGTPDPASPRAVSDTRLLELHKDDFEAFVAARPRAMRSVLAAISRRAVQANQRLLADEPRDTSAASDGRVYATFSPRGGSGKTLLATRLALELAERMPRRVALLDLDLVFDDAALELEVTPSTALAALSDTQVQRLDARALSDLLVEAEHSGGLRVLVGAKSPEDGERVTPAHVRAVLAALRRQFAAIVVDCASTFSEQTLAALEVADRVFVVCTPELGTLRDLHEVRRIFGQALRVDRTKISFVLNHPSPTVGLSRRQFEDTLEQKVLLDIEHAGEDATKPSFGRAINQLADELAPAKSASKGGVMTLFGRGRRAS